MAKRSRRERRQEPGKQRQFTSPQITPVEASEAETASAVVAKNEPAPPAKASQAAPANNRKAINFAQEYFYVYGELRNILIITVLMFMVMAGLSFVI